MEITTSMSLDYDAVKWDIRSKRKKQIKQVCLIGINIITALVILFPLLYAFSIALMPGGELYTNSTKDRKSVV